MSFSLGAISNGADLLSLQKPAVKKAATPFDAVSNASASNTSASASPSPAPTTSRASSGSLFQLTPDTLLAAQSKNADPSQPQQSPQEAWKAFQKNLQDIFKNSPNNSVILGQAQLTPIADAQALASTAVSIIA